MELELEKEVRRKPELSCPVAGIDICGRLIVERERYTRLEDELERTKQNMEKYRHLFSALLRQVESRLILHIIPQVFRHSLSKISQVKLIHCFQRRNIVDFWVFLEEENWEAEDQIYEIYGDMLSMFVDYDIRMKLLRLWGRKPEALLPAGGVKIFG